jgi:hypothetical protein
MKGDIHQWSLVTTRRGSLYGHMTTFIMWKSHLLYKKNNINFSEEKPGIMYLLSCTCYISNRESVYSCEGNVCFLFLDLIVDTVLIHADVASMYTQIYTTSDHIIVYPQI